MKTVTAVLFSLALFFSLAACASAAPDREMMSLKSAEAPALARDSAVSRELSLEQIQEIVRTILPEGERAVDLISGRVLQPEIPKDAPAVKGPDFFPVEDEEYRSVADLQEEFEQVFTRSAAREYYKLCFEGDSPVYQEIDGKLCYNRNHDEIGVIPEWHVNTAIIMRQTVDEITVEMEASIDGSGTEKRDLSLKKVKEAWLLDSRIDR